MKITHCSKDIYKVPSISVPCERLGFPALDYGTLSWFALYVQVRHEKEVAKRLELRGVESFLPLMNCWSKRKDRRKLISAPLFPGYVFVHTVLDGPANLHIVKTPGALTVVRNSEGPLPIPTRQIDNLKTLLKSPEILIPHRYLKEGDWVEVVRGPLTGCKGILLRQDPKKGRLVVGVDIIRQAVGVELNMEDVEPIAHPR